MEKNKEKYFKPIAEVALRLYDRGVPYEIINSQDGYMIYVKLPNDFTIDAICHSYSYGHQEGLLEIMGGLTEEEHEEDTVLGYLTPESVIKRFTWCYQNDSYYYKGDERLE